MFTGKKTVVIAFISTGLAVVGTAGWMQHTEEQRSQSTLKAEQQKSQVALDALRQQHNQDLLIERQKWETNRLEEQTQEWRVVLSDLMKTIGKEELAQHHVTITTTADQCTSDAFVTTLAAHVAPHSANVLRLATSGMVLVTEKDRNQREIKRKEVEQEIKKAADRLTQDFKSKSSPCLAAATKPNERQNALNLRDTLIKVFVIGL